MTRKIWMSLLFLTIPLCACQTSGHSQSKPPSVEELLALDQHANLFQWGETIYQTNDWTNQLTVTKQKQIGVIKKTSTKHVQHGTASQLKKGTSLYSVKERRDLLIAEDDGQLKIYAAHAEG
ncbi:hypothetical protein QUF51_01960 [Bacillus pumilus]|nr:hypothetical protein [Bacillus pumilus]